MIDPLMLPHSVWAKQQQEKRRRHRIENSLVVIRGFVSAYFGAKLQWTIFFTSSDQKKAVTRKGIFRGMGL
jgi:hypothetical protein